MTLDSMEHSKSAHFWHSFRHGLLEGVGWVGLLAVIGWMPAAVFADLKGTSLEMNDDSLMIAPIIGAIALAAVLYGGYHRRRSLKNYRGLVDWKPDTSGI